VELRHLKFFVAVAEELSFTKAADRLHVSQPSVSRQVRELEEELKAPLLVRDRQRVRLTDQGQAALTQARTALAEVAAVAAAVNGLARRETATVRVGIAIPLAKSIQPLVTEYARQFPRVDVRYQDVPSAIQDQIVRQQEIDVGIFTPPFDRRQIESEHLFDESYRVLLPRSSPLASRTSLRLKDLEGEVVFLLDVDEASNRALLQRAHQTHARLQVAATSAVPHQAGSALVAAGKGIYVLPGSPVTVNFPAFGPEIAVIPLDEPIVRELHMIWRKGESAAAVLNYVETARKVFALKAAGRHAGDETRPARIRGAADIG